jgi:hypothetical protein
MWLLWGTRSASTVLCCCRCCCSCARLAVGECRVVQGQQQLVLGLPLGFAACLQGRGAAGLQALQLDAAAAGCSDRSELAFQARKCGGAASG